jgi:hypothetical protein
MVHRDTFLNKINELGYRYKSECAHTQLFKKKGSTHFIFVRTTQLLEDDYVTGVLRQAGVPEKEVRAFIACARVPEKPV